MVGILESELPVHIVFLFFIYYMQAGSSGARYSERKKSISHFRFFGIMPARKPGNARKNKK
jgi:hypothetical protein